MFFLRLYYFFIFLKEISLKILFVAEAAQGRSLLKDRPCDSAVFTSL